MKRNPRLKLFIRTTENGFTIPGSEVLRTQPPKVGTWIDITQATSCCASNGNAISYVVFQGSIDGLAKINSISYPGYTWTDPGHYQSHIVVPIPANYGGTLTVNVTVTTGATGTFTPSVLQGDGTISMPVTTGPDGTTANYVIHADALPASQYLVDITGE